MIERVRIDPPLYRVGPLLVRDCHVSNRPSGCSCESFRHLSHRRSLADQGVHTLRRSTRILQQSGGNVGYIFGTYEWDDGRILAPRQEDSALLGDAPADKSAHIFVVGRCLEMNSAYLRPVEDAIGQPMLQIAEAGGVL